MDKLTDLELITAIAKIENVDILWPEEIKDSNGDLKARLMETLMEVTERHDNGNWAHCSEYNPLTDKAMLWDLMVKHDVDVIHYDDGGGLVLKGVFEFSFYDDGELPRAILECIGANNG